MNIKFIIGVLMSLAIAGYWSVYTGNYLKDFNPYFKSINVYILYIGMFVFMMVILAVVYSALGYKNYIKEYESLDEDTKKQASKQTYLEYVEERLKIERLLK